MTNPDWFRIEYETAPLTSREEWLAEIDARYQQEYERVKARRDSEQERAQQALRAEMEEQQKDQPELERRYREQEKERKEREKRALEERKRGQIENEPTFATGFHFDDR
jgi:hypothetical protein